MRGDDDTDLAETTPVELDDGMVSVPLSAGAFHTVRTWRN